MVIFWSFFTFPHLIAVSSTVLGLTALFEMGRGEHQSYRLHKTCETSVSMSYVQLTYIVKDVEQVRIKFLVQRYHKLLGN